MVDEKDDDSEEKKEEKKIFGSNIKERIKNSRSIKDSSLKTYICALKTLKKKIEPDKPVTLLNTKFLQNFNKVMVVINKEAKI